MSSKKVINNQVILEEVFNEKHLPTVDDIDQYAKVIGINPRTEPQLMWIARQGIHAPLPENWKACQDPSGEIYYFNFSCGESIWDHPCDEFYRKMVIEEREKGISRNEHSVDQRGKVTTEQKKDKQGTDDEKNKKHMEQEQSVVEHSRRTKVDKSSRNESTIAKPPDTIRESKDIGTSKADTANKNRSALHSKKTIYNQIILEELYNEKHLSSEDDITQYAEVIGINSRTEPELLWIARQGLHAPLPEDWKACQDPGGNIYFFNFSCGESIWDHPCDAFYRKMVIEERKKLTFRDGSENSDKEKTKVNYIAGTKENKEQGKDNGEKQTGKQNKPSEVDQIGSLLDKQQLGVESPPLEGVESPPLEGVESPPLEGVDMATTSTVEGKKFSRNSKSIRNNQVILEEVIDQTCPATEDNISEYAEFIGINPHTEPQLMWIARQGMLAPLPQDWKPCKDPNVGIYYFNFSSGESIWDRPCDEHFKKMVIEERNKSISGK